MSLLLTFAPEVADALHARRPVVALESALITHGLPWPLSIETAREAEAAVRAEGAVPATIAVLKGKMQIGLSPAELEEFAQSFEAVKASRRDLAATAMQGKTAGTTVAATLFLAHCAGIPILATGGIGGVHRGASQSFDISADLLELAYTPVCAVCAGAKAIVDIAATLEVLETHGVPVLGWSCDDMPAFYVRSSGLKVQLRLDTPDAVATFLATHWSWGGKGVALAQPPPEASALSKEEFAEAFHQAAEEAQVHRVAGKDLTPFLLTRLAVHTKGKSLEVNRDLVVANARLAAQVANALQARIEA